MTDFVAHLTRQAAFSRATYGPGPRTQGVIDHVTKELDSVKAEFEQADIAPAGWGKMKVAEKRSWLKRNLDAFRKALAPAQLPAHAREKKAWDARKKAQQALVRKHGNFVTNKRMQPYLAAMNGPAADPQPMTRQVARQNQRRALKALLSDQKAGALKAKRKGGAASVISVEAA